MYGECEWRPSKKNVYARLMELLKKTDRIHLKDAARMLRRSLY